MGAGTFGTLGGMDQPTADAQVRCALDHGVNFFDTSDAYFLGESEQMLGQAFRNLGVDRSSIFVSSKVNNPVGPGPNDRGSTRVHIKDGIKKSLKRLQMDYVDLYQLHSHDPITPVEETMRALDDLVREGVVRYIGASNWFPYRISKAQALAERYGWTRLASTQGYYCLSGRDIERELIPCVQEEGIGLLAWSPLDGGFLSGKFKRDGVLLEGTRQAQIGGYPPVNKPRAFDCIDVMREISDATGVSIPQIAIAWVMQRPAVTAVLLGARRVEQLADTLKAADVTLDPEHVARLDEVSKLPSEYPGWIHAKQANERLPVPFPKS